jgi:hypothetical protein
MLMAAVPGADWRELAELPLGQRQAHLLSVREKTFGSLLEVFVECPGCEAELEFEIDTTVERQAEAAEPSPNATFALEVGEFDLELRLANTADLLALELAGRVGQAGQVGQVGQVGQAGETSVETVRRELFSRCALEVRRRGDLVEASCVPDEVIALAAEEMSARDPQAESLRSLECPMCSHQWQAVFEIVDYLWREIEVDVRRLFREIDLLARTYGWSEDQILALSPFRRRCYMELIVS